MLFRSHDLTSELLLRLDIVSKHDFAELAASQKAVRDMIAVFEKLVDVSRYRC